MTIKDVAVRLYKEELARKKKQRESELEKQFNDLRANVQIVTGQYFEAFGEPIEQGNPFASTLVPQLSMSGPSMIYVVQGGTRDYYVQFATINAKHSYRFIEGASTADGFKKTDWNISEVDFLARLGEYLSTGSLISAAAGR